MRQSLTRIFTTTTGIMSKIQLCQLAILARFVMATIFWKSAMTKIAFSAEGVAEFSLAQIWHVISLNWTVADSTYMLFEYEYDLPVIPFLLPIALVLGFFTRYAALAMLGMTMVIQIFVYPELWTVHALWALALLVIMSKGGGRLSLDRLICGKCL